MAHSGKGSAKNDLGEEALAQTHCLHPAKCRACDGLQGASR